MSYDKQYIITESREPKENEFIFTGGSTQKDVEEKRRLWQYLEDNFGIAREKIPHHLIGSSRDHAGLSGFRIIKVSSTEGYTPYND